MSECCWSVRAPNLIEAERHKKKRPIVEFKKEIKRRHMNGESDNSKGSNKTEWRRTGRPFRPITQPWQAMMEFMIDSASIVASSIFSRNENEIHLRLFFLEKRQEKHHPPPFFPPFVFRRHLSYRLSLLLSASSRQTDKNRQTFKMARMSAGRRRRPLVTCKRGREKKLSKRTDISI